MKFIAIRINIALLALLLITSCGGNDSKSEQATEALSCTAVKTQFETLKDQEVTIKGFCLGNNATTTGDIYLNMDDKKKIGFGLAPTVVAVFPGEATEKVQAIATEAEVTIKGTVSESKSGSIYITNPSIQ